ncbi:LptF/LptG family permease [Arenibacter sp. GZD-96]|uniref:LptF/LptG family permease n=1 Tax=Aurantibrevibacter litoralis TaxID=3106030 RepID=UPI003A4D6D93
MLIFIFQTIWLFIDDLAGKGLDVMIIGKFLFYIMPNLTEKVLPLTVLLSSILTFGTFAENYEFAAMKASGISLQRAMLSLIVFVTFLGGVTFYFADNVIPAAEQKIYNLRRNIAQVKPAVAIAEGVFSDFEGTGMNIKVDKKYGDNDRFLQNVIIHKKTKTYINNTVIKAKTGELVSSEDSDILSLVLRDGHYYEDLKPKDTKDDPKNPFAKSDFETYVMNMDFSELNNVDLEAEREVNTDKMKNVSRLRKDIDSLKNDNIDAVTAFSKNISNRMGAFLPQKQRDTSLATSAKTRKKDTLTALEGFENELAILDIKDIPELYPEYQKIQIYNNAKNASASIVTTIEGKKLEFQKRFKVYNMHILSLHKKFALAFSCIILFFVGAPLGAIIRKGGLGLPMVIAIILFLIYYFIGVFAGNYAKEGNIHPIFGAWLATMIMLPLGIILTQRATADKGLMNIGSAIDFIKEFVAKYINLKKR